MTRPPPRSTLFPYMTLFRSRRAVPHQTGDGHRFSRSDSQCAGQLRAGLRQARPARHGWCGCGVATTLVMWFMLACMVLHLKRASLYRACGLFERFEWPNWPVQRSLLGLGLPIGISLFAETSMFALIAVLIGSLGAVVVASHQVTLSLSSLVFMVPFSLGLAITVRVGHNLGMHGARTALFSAKVGIAVALFCATVS